MLNHRSSSVSRIKMLVALPLITISVLYCSDIGYSQSKRTSTGNITFGNMKGPRYRTTYSAILADPVARTSKPGCSVETCTMSFLPKSESVLGPYKCPGGKMKQELINYLKKYKGENIKVFIEDIMLNCDGKIDSSQMPIVLVATEKM